MPRRKRRHLSDDEEEDVENLDLEDDMPLSKRARDVSPVVERRRSQRERKTRVTLHYCPKCMLSFMDLDEMTAHLFSHRGPTKARHVKEFVCSKCDDKFSSSKKFKDHMRRHERKATPSPPPPPPASVSHPEKQCRGCLVVFDSLQDLYQHYGQHSEHWDGVTEPKKVDNLLALANGRPNFVQNAQGYCGVCFYRYLSEKDEGFHKFRICIPTCQTCQQPVGTNPELYQAHARSHFDVVYQCASCKHYDLLAEFPKHSLGCKAQDQETLQLEYMCHGCEFVTHCVKLMFLHGLSNCCVQESPEDTKVTCIQCRHCVENLEKITDLPATEKSALKLPPGLDNSRIVYATRSQSPKLKVCYIITALDRILVPEKTSQPEDVPLTECDAHLPISNGKSDSKLALKSFAKIEASFLSSSPVLSAKLSHLRQNRGQTSTVKAKKTETWTTRGIDGVLSTMVLGKKPTESRLKTDITAPTPNTFKCDHCGKIYSTQRNLEDHLQIDCRGPVEIADKAKSKDVNDTHSFKIEKLKKPVHCPFCMEAFIVVHQFKAHLRSCSMSYVSSEGDLQKIEDEALVNSSPQRNGTRGRGRRKRT